MLMWPFRLLCHIGWFQKFFLCQWVCSFVRSFAFFLSALCRIGNSDWFPFCHLWKIYSPYSTKLQNGCTIRHYRFIHICANVTLIWICSVDSRHYFNSFFLHFLFLFLSPFKLSVQMRITLFFSLHFSHFSFVRLLLFIAQVTNAHDSQLKWQMNSVLL